MSDVGERVASKSGGLVQVARCNPKNPERDCQRVLINKFGLSLLVERSHLGSLEHIPILKIRRWFEFLLHHSCLHILHGLRERDAAREEAICSSFWAKFEKLQPQHKVFEEASQGRINLSRALPLVLHGDEGRGRKRTAHFVLSFHSLIGLGFSKSQSSMAWDRMECNFEGHSFTNRFLIATLRKKDYSDHEWETWDTLMAEVAEEAGSMWQVPVKNRDDAPYWGIVLGIIGDWPFLHKSGDFTRSFNNIQKRVNVRNPPRGICHLCLAGTPQWDFEQLETRRPDWMRTLFTEDPFQHPSPFVTHLLHEPGREPNMWFFDWFHTMHLGVARYYLGSVLALLSEQQPESNIDDRFDSLCADYKSWCQRNSRRAHVMRLSKESIAWETTKSYPSGQWHKGELSTVLMDYVEYKFKTQSFPHEQLLVLAGEACEAIQRCSRIFYRSSMWISPEKCGYCAELILKFLRKYSQMATLSKTRHRCLFVLQPKLHCLHHFGIQLWDAHKRNIYGMNPLATSCQPSEDFIGRPSRLSRRVTAQRPILHRVMDRYLESAYYQFIQAGFLLRSGG